MDVGSASTKPQTVPAAAVAAEDVAAMEAAAAVATVEDTAAVKEVSIFERVFEIMFANR